MMNPYLLEVMLREKRRELLEEAARQHMLAPLRRRRRWPAEAIRIWKIWNGHLCLRLGTSLLQIGCWLQKQGTASVGESPRHGAPAEAHGRTVL